MARKRIRKNALCPLCHSWHDIYGRYWLIPAKKNVDAEGVMHLWAGWQSEFWCDVEMKCVVKQYAPNYSYIGYYIDREIPF